MVKVGVAFGRFQVLHLKHIEYLLAAKMRCKKLVIGITYPDASYLKSSGEGEPFERVSENPLTYYERFIMIHDAMIDFGVRREEFDIVPLPINKKKQILNYTPKEATYFMSICNEWGEEIARTLESLGVDIDILWQKSEEDRGTTGTEVRNAIRNNEDWRPLVPKTVYEYMLDHKIDERIKALSA